MATQNWQLLRELGESISDAFVGMLQELDAQVQEGGGGSQPGVQTLAIAFDDPNLSEPETLYPITAVSTDDGTFTIAGNHAAVFPAGLIFVVTSGANAGQYEVASAVFGSSTVITVNPDVYGTPSDPTVEGSLGTFGVVFYTPTSEDVAAGLWLLDAWVQVDEAWDGSTPQLDIGTGFGSVYGLFSDTKAEAVDMTVADLDGDAGNTGGAGLLTSNTGNSALAPGLNNFANGTGRLAPARITATNPLKAWIATDGQLSSGSPDWAQGSGVLCYRIGKA